MLWDTVGFTVRMFPSHFALTMLFLLSLLPSASADRGMLSLAPGVSIYEPGQKAIIAWNGREEILILSTDVHADANTTVLEVMPLPSNPVAIEKASFESFVAVQDLTQRNAPTLTAYGRSVGGEGVQVTFHEKIGAHDITVAKASNANELVEWAENFLRSNQISLGQRVSLREFEPVVEGYMARGFRFFVLDLMELSPKPNSAEPILYRFETSFLYYPLKISSPLPGKAKITLFVITWGRMEGFDYSPLRMAYYRRPAIGADEEVKPIQFSLSRGELALIDLRIGELFGDTVGTAWLTVLEYDGLFDGLKRDLMVAEEAVAPPTEQTDWPGNAVHALLLGMALGALCALAGGALTYLLVRTKRARIIDQG